MRFPLLALPAFALLLASGAGPADRLGVGVATVDVASGLRLDLFSAPGDVVPAAAVLAREDAGALTFVLDPEGPDGLSPEALSADFLLLAFRVLAVTDGGFEVVINAESGRTMWLRAQPGVEYKPWAQYLVENVTSFGRLDAAANPLRAAPDAGTAPVSYEGAGGWDCLAVSEVRGEWVRVKLSELCASDDAAPVDGWVRWRDGEELLIGYGLVC